MRAYEQQSLLPTPQKDRRKAPEGVGAADAGRIAVLLENAIRASPEAAQRFIEPSGGVLDMAQADRHHLVFGRRGSGKSSLLYKLLQSAEAQRQPCAFVDLESVKGLEYPDVLIVVLQRTFQALADWLSTIATAPRTAKIWRRRHIYDGPLRKPLKRRDAERLVRDLKLEIAGLEALLHEPLEAPTTRTQTEIDEFTVGGGLTAQPLDLRAARKHGENRALQVNFQSSKVQTLNRGLAKHQSLMSKLSNLAEKPTLLLLDDLYHVPTSSQPYVLDYFHRLAKGLPVRLKVGTIRHRSKWFQNGDPPIGVEIPHDVSALDLDKTLENFRSAKAFLHEVADKVLEPAQTSLSTLLRRRSLDRLVLASGGVARDFLSLLGASIRVGLEERPTQLINVGAIDINTAAGDLEKSKRDELARDVAAGEDAMYLLDALDKVREHCYEQKINCFLIEQDAPAEKTDPIRQLVDMRLIHSVKNRVTISNRPGRIYEAFMLDISQWTGQRKRRNLKEVAFWTPSGAEELRQVRLVYAARS